MVFYESLGKFLTKPTYCVSLMNKGNVLVIYTYCL